jgi:hypothetical protein
VYGDETDETAEAETSIDVEDQATGDQPSPSANGDDETVAQIRALGDGLADLEGAELGVHVDRYQQIHAGLQEALAEIDNA